MKGLAITYLQEGGRSMSEARLKFKVTGTPYDGRQGILKGIFNGSKRELPVELVPETRNPHDSFAVGVWMQGSKIGYVPRTLSRDIFECMGILRDSTGRVFEDDGLLCAEVTATYGEE